MSFDGFNFEGYKNLRNLRRSGEPVNADQIGVVITDIKGQIKLATLDLGTVILANAEAFAMQRLHTMTKGEHGDAEATVTDRRLGDIERAGRYLQKLVYWQKKATLGLGSDKSLPGSPWNSVPEDYDSCEDSDSYGPCEVDSPDLLSGVNALSGKLNEESKAAKLVCHNCGFGSTVDPCGICGNAIN